MRARVCLRGGPLLFGWLVGRTTVALVPGEHVVCASGLFKVCYFSVENGAAVARGCAYVYVRRGPSSFSLPWLDFVAGEGWGLVDCTRVVVECAAAQSAANDASFFDWFYNLNLRTLGMDLTYVHRYKLESDTPAGMRMPLLGGMPSIDTALGEWSAAELTSVYERCLECAKAATGYRPPPGLSPPQTENVEWMLRVAALRTFAGVYRVAPETMDDRTFHGAKLWSNGDCDDMALSAAALARVMWPAVVAYVVNGRSSAAGGGHTWCILKAGERLIMVEATTTTSAFVGDLPELYGAGTFKPCERDGTGVPPLHAASYERVLAMYTASSVEVPTFDGYLGAPLEAVLRSTHAVVRPPPSAEPGPVLCAARALRASPSPSALRACLTPPILAALTGGKPVVDDVGLIAGGYFDPLSDVSTIVDVTRCGNFVGARA